ncbi:hypothetical protein K435DRAFT_862048 [Dendrothele bispora CBS 962.96]|uniref:Uncharacterized protein n=1 Tax=Dendrothele bispora (strain CBS 962.96) TaxID=1314807 RepID=A0A4S8LTK9_DENBC|nr:hypothetical protein K435DRAFT_862048 [Dendrothele bispora CBS 962.96]
MSSPRITAAMVRQKPKLLLHSAKPGTPLRHFDGLVGAVISDSGQFVRSPNMDIIYSPLQVCNTRMCRDYHFGCDDPLYFPQPFHASVGHLAVIPVPSCLPDHELALAWYHPTSVDFVPQNPSKPWIGIGLLRPNLSQDLRLFCENLINSIIQLPGQLNQDSALSNGQDHLRRLIERLEMPTTQEECFLYLSCLQRQYLELYARLKWITVYTPRLRDVDNSCPVDCHVIGAFTEDLDVAAQLYRTGIPIWVVRPVDELCHVRIDQVVEPITESFNQHIPIRDSADYIDVTDAVPAHPVIYNGLPGKAERYIRMGRYIKNFNSYSMMGVFGTGSTVSPSSSAMSLSTTQDKVHSVIVNGAGKGKVKPQPYRKPAPRKSTSTVNQPRNKFEHLNNPFNPPVVSAWASAQVELSELSHTLPEPKLGYYLPEPEMLISSVNDATKSRLVCSWIRIRDIFLYRLSNPSSEPRLLRNQQWRHILELGAGLKYSATSKSAQKVTNEMHELLMNYLDDSQRGVKVQVESLASAPVLWRGSALEHGEIPSTELVKEVLWELYEISFHLELMTLDRQLLPELDWNERQLVLNRCWPGLAFRVDLNETDKGLSGSTLVNRLPFIHSLYSVMSQWPGEKPDVFMRPFPSHDDFGSEEAFISVALEVEKNLARFYVRTFLNTFQRPAIVPHHL